MLHQDVQGGEQWLPFARTLIRRLRALGLPYAAKRFTMSDGTTVAARIEPGREFIQIRGGNAELWLLVNVEEIDYLPVVLQSTGAPYRKTRTRRSKLYRFKANNFSAKNAKLEYEGTTVFAMEATVTGTDPIAGEIYSINSTITRTGRGAIDGFVATGGNFLAWAHDAKVDYPEDKYQLGNPRIFTTDTQLVWREGQHTYTSVRTESAGSGSVVGEQLWRLPVVVAPDEFSFHVGQLTGALSTGAPIPLSIQKKRLLKGSNTITDDLDYIDPSELTDLWVSDAQDPADRAYWSRRQVGHVGQTAKWIFDISIGAQRTRQYHYTGRQLPTIDGVAPDLSDLSLPPQNTTGFLGDETVLGLKQPVDDAGVKQPISDAGILGIYNYGTPLVTPNVPDLLHTIDVRELPHIMEDDAYADRLRAGSGMRWASAANNSFPVVRYIEVLSALNLDVTFNFEGEGTGYPNLGVRGTRNTPTPFGPVQESTVTVFGLIDQKVLWGK